MNINELNWLLGFLSSVIGVLGFFAVLSKKALHLIWQLLPHWFVALFHKKSLDNPFIAGHFVYCNQFIGRKAVLRRVIGQIKTVQNVAIWGESYIGKTSLLKTIERLGTEKCQEYIKNTYKIELPDLESYHFIYVNFRDIRFRNQTRFLQHIINQLELDEQDILSLPEDETESLALFCDILTDNLKNSTIILLDNIEAALEHDFSATDFWDALRSLSTSMLDNHCLGFILTSTQNPQHFEFEGNSSKFFNIFGDVIHLDAFSEAESKQLMALSPKKFKDVDSKFILEHSQNKPLFLQILCYELYEAMCEGETCNTWQDKALQKISEIPSQDA
ncbi:AAA family ATPase [Candidatus Albibeggiatoa sp. nov. NOAA]|uniref:AAA family ATPase n=1 Tax=Candidatus Albibeggiatoa sp. nov. NOAA TaxID=3162724 RepID=UPI0032F0BAD4|nr:ATP-binding protein [Thiotrichaceae bacterium]